MHFFHTCISRVTEQKKVLVSEYGLTKDLFDRDQYLIEDGKTKNLVKWMAPEITESLEFSAQSDVVSYAPITPDPPSPPPTHQEEVVNQSFHNPRSTRVGGCLGLYIGIIELLSGKTCTFALSYYPFS